MAIIDDVKIIEDKKYFRIEFFIGKWKFHSAKMPILQAEELRLLIKNG